MLEFDLLAAFARSPVLAWMRCIVGFQSRNYCPRMVPIPPERIDRSHAMQVMFHNRNICARWRQHSSLYSLSGSDLGKMPRHSTSTESC